MIDPDSSLDEALQHYLMGHFPMADSAGASGLHWFVSGQRSLLPIDGLHVGRSLRKTLARAPFEIRVDSDFAGVIGGCAEPRKGEAETWINPAIRDLMLRLHAAGIAHSVECWRDDRLAGGVYGVALGQVFCGESMFSRETNASKVALAHLCARLWAGGFRMFDTQYINPHVARLGAYEISQRDYEDRLAVLSQGSADFRLPGREQGALLHRWLQMRQDCDWTLT
jgi:leucyl/phenylalanyl-tRNA--protein transferase